MIEQPPEILFCGILSFVSLLGGGAISLLMVFNEREYGWLCVAPVIIGIILMAVLTIIIFPIGEEYRQQIELEIENATCEQLPLMYDEYISFQEKIKSKYLFDCVADKQDLEWMK